MFHLSVPLLALLVTYGSFELTLANCAATSGGDTTLPIHHMHAGP